MTYSEWYAQHAEKHEKIMKSLEGLEKEEIIEYFIFDNMKKRHPDFCPLYAENRKCHEIEVLNCYFCACMHFRFSDKGIKKKGEKVCYSFCQINAKKQQHFETERAIHLDCSACTLPHQGSVIKKYFSRDWKAVMRNTNIK